MLEKLNPLNWFKRGPTDQELAVDVSYAIRGIPPLNNAVKQLSSILADSGASKDSKEKAQVALEQIQKDMLELVRQSHKLGDKEVPEQGFFGRTFSAFGTAVKSAFPTAGMVALAGFGLKTIGDAVGAGQYVGTRLSDKEREGKLIGAESAAVVKFLEGKEPALAKMDKSTHDQAINARLQAGTYTAELVAVRAAARSNAEKEIKEAEGSPAQAGLRQGLGLGALALIINTLSGTFFGAGKQAAEQKHEALVQVHALLRGRGVAQAAPQSRSSAYEDDEFIGSGVAFNQRLGGRQPEGRI